jgi:hypothetical protein
MSKANEIYEILKQEKAEKINQTTLIAKKMVEKYEQEMIEEIEKEYQLFEDKIEKIIFLAHSTRAICGPIQKFEVAFERIGKKYKLKEDSKGHPLKEIL